MNPHSHRVHTG